MTFDVPSAPVRVLRGLTLLFALNAAACSDPTGPPIPTGEAVGVVLASADRTLTVFAVEDPTDRFSIGLGPDGSPVTLAARGNLVAVPLGSVPAVAVVDLEARAVTRTVALPEGSGATGVAFLNDSIAIVANPSLNTVSPINVLRGTRGADIPVGTYPQAAVAVDDTVFVINANLGPDFSPAGPATVSVITGAPAQVVRTITLSGVNAGAGAATADGRVVIVQAGSFGAANGSVSIVDRATLTETRHVTGFGDFPGAVAVGPDGRIHVGSFSYGIAIWDPPTSAFVHPPDDAVEPDGIPSVSGLAFDDDGRLYSLVPECQAPSRVLRLTAALEVAAGIPVGTCPFGIAFTRIDP
jgi:hypothetical protein